MADKKQLDRVYSFITRYMVDKGRAPFYTEIAEELGLPPARGRQALHDLIETGVPAWLFPNTDHISAFSPFSSLPTQYRITVGGEQKWYGQ
ncbi:MAG: hypothetical protein ABFD62_13580 [Syntrophaceae bacterium]